MSNPRVEKVFFYHSRSKHGFFNFAPSPEHLDWSNQPDLFRTYADTEQFRLPLLKGDPDIGHEGLYRSSDKIPKDFNSQNIASFLELSMGLSAWKEYDGNRWPLRINPSSGNLHPTECYLIVPETELFPAGIYHYNPLFHSLEKRATLPELVLKRIRGHFGSDGFLVGLSSIFWREAWKYGERAFRYCNHDIGHALACLRFAANLPGWKIKILDGISDQNLGRVLGFDRTEWYDLEEEYPEALCFIYDSNTGDIPDDLGDILPEEFAVLPLSGKPNKLSENPRKWEMIYSAANASEKITTAKSDFDLPEKQDLPILKSEYSAAQIIRKRRSAVAYDPERSISLDVLLSMLEKTLPACDRAPFDLKIINPCAHLAIFVHNITDLPRGLYLFVRDDKDHDLLKDTFHRYFLWEQVDDSFPLYCLQEEDFRSQAKLLSCDQDIAGNSCFSLGMIARFREIIEADPYRYRRLFWECGMIGQVLYLEAEAYGIRGTGIGCYFDDEVHALLGIKSSVFQSLYHFTAGCPIDDNRLTSYPPYEHLKNEI